MKHSGALSITASGDREIIITRAFDAPRDLVFDALTKPELLKQWFGVFGGWELAVCEVDLTVGGAYRYLWRGPDGSEMGLRGVYREIVPPERLVALASFDESWYPGDELETLVLVEQNGRTTLTNTVLYESREARDIALTSDMEQGLSAGYDKLAELLTSWAEQGIR